MAPLPPMIHHIDYSHTKIRQIDWGWCRQIDRNFRFSKLTSAPTKFSEKLSEIDQQYVKSLQLILTQSLSGNSVANCLMILMIWALKDTFPSLFS